MSEESMTTEECQRLFIRLFKDLETMKSFECERPGACGKGAVCNSCWARRMASRTLPKLEKLERDLRYEGGIHGRFFNVLGR